MSGQVWIVQDAVAPGRTMNDMQMKWIVILAAALGLQAARSTDYSLAITNNMPHAMNFSWRIGDSTPEHLLGTVAANATRVFIITSPSSTSIIVTEWGDAMPAYEQRLKVRLRADSTVHVVF